MPGPSSEAKLRKAEELKERLKKWREEKEAKGKPPLKRPLGQVNSLPDLKDTKRPKVLKPSVVRPKPTAVVKPQTQQKPSSNQENVAKKTPGNRALAHQESEDLRKKLEEWKKKREEEKKFKKEQNRGIPFVPSGKTNLPSAKTPRPQLSKQVAAPSKAKPDINRRQTINGINPTVLKRIIPTPATQRVSEKSKTSTSKSRIDSRRQTISGIKPRVLKKTVPTLAASQRVEVSKSKVDNRRQTISGINPRVLKRTVPTPVSMTQRVPVSERAKTNTAPHKGRPDTNRRQTLSGIKPTVLKRTLPSRAPLATQKIAGESKTLAPKPEALSTLKQNKLAAPARKVLSTQGNSKVLNVTQITTRPPFSARNTASSGMPVPPKSQSNLVRRQSPRNKAGVKRLSVPTSRPIKIKESNLRRSLPSSVPLKKLPILSAPTDQSDGEKKKKLPQRKSILKPLPLSTEPIQEENSQDPEKTPPVEARGAGVRFTIPGGTPVTPSTPRTGPKRMTPQQARRQKLNEWLISKGKTPTRFRHLCCFDEQVSAKKKKVAGTKPGLSADELAKQQNQIEQEVSMTEPADTQPPEPETQVSSSVTKNTRRDSILEEDIAVGTESDEELKTMLDECTQLYDAGCPAESVIGWLDDIEKHYPCASVSAAYWICRAKIVEDAGDDHVTVDIYERACRNNAQPAIEMAQALQQFVVRMEERARNKAMAAHTPRKTQKVQAENAFESSSVKYCISNTTPFFKKLHKRADQEGTPMSVITPVRRSTRRSLATLPDMLRDHDVIVEALEDVPKADRATTLFLPNAAISDEDDTNKTDAVNVVMLSPVPVERSLEAEFSAAADDSDDEFGL